MNAIQRSDRILQGTLHAFTANAVRAYADDMRYSAKPFDQEAKAINHSQACYEVSTLAITAVLRTIAGQSPEDTEPLPEPIQTAWQALHDAICKHGDNVLISKGFTPPE